MFPMGSTEGMPMRTAGRDGDGVVRDSAGHVSGPKVLFVCIENAGRSQIAEALYGALSSGFGEARSAGTHPAVRIHPHVSKALAERGVAVSEARPRKLDVDVAEWADLVVTMGCGDSCPVTGKPTLDWSLPDPKGMSSAELAQLIDRIELLVADLIGVARRHATRA